MIATEIRAKTTSIQVFWNNKKHTFNNQAFDRNKSPLSMDNTLISFAIDR